MKFKKYLVASLCVAAMGITAPSLMQAGDNLDVSTEIISMEDTILQTKFQNVEISLDGRYVYFDGDRENPLHVVLEGESIEITIIDPERGVEVHFDKSGYATVLELSEATLRKFETGKSEAEQFIHESQWLNVSIPVQTPAGNNGAQVGFSYTVAPHNFIHISPRFIGTRGVNLSVVSLTNGDGGWATNVVDGQYARFGVSAINTHTFVSRTSVSAAPAIPNAQVRVWTVAN